MPGYFTDYLNNKVLDLALGGVALPAVATLYVGLSTLAANKAGTVAEPAAGYARVASTNNLTNFPAAASGAKSNATAVTFPTPTGAWGTILSVFIADAATAGNILMVADLATPKILAAGSAAPVIAIGALYLSHT